MDTLIAAAIAVGLLKPADPATAQPQVMLACTEGWHRATDRCVRDRRPAGAKPTVPSIFRDIE